MFSVISPGKCFFHICVLFQGYLPAGQLQEALEKLTKRVKINSESFMCIIEALDRMVSTVLKIKKGQSLTEGTLKRSSTFLNMKTSHFQSYHSPAATPILKLYSHPPPPVSTTSPLRSLIDFRKIHH